MSSLLSIKFIAPPNHSLRLTVVPAARERSKVLPAGTMKELMLTVVHLTAAATSSKDEMVPTQEEAPKTEETVVADRRRTSVRADMGDKVVSFRNGNSVVKYSALVKQASPNS